MKYKVGDKVKIVEVVKGNLSRREHVGKIVTVKKINPNRERTYNEPHYSTSETSPFIFFESELAPVNSQKIVITTDGVETLARLYDGKTVIKSATAKCSPDDTFDFNTGAKLAFDRLIGEEKKEQGWRVVDRPARKGDYIRLTEEAFSFSKIGDVLKVHEAIDGLAVVLAGDHPRDTKTPPNFRWNYGEYGYEVIEPCEKPETPKYFTGKAVCYEKGSGFAYTVGKVYEFKDGHTVNDNGFKSCHNAVISLEAWNKEYGHFAKFIPFVE